MGWQKNLFKFFHNILHKKPNKLFGRSNLRDSYLNSLGRSGEGQCQGLDAIIPVLIHSCTHSPSPGPSAAGERGVCFPQPRHPAGHVCPHFRAQPVCEEALPLACFMPKETEPQTSHPASHSFSCRLGAGLGSEPTVSGSRVHASHQAATLLLTPQLLCSAQHKVVHIPPHRERVGIQAKGNEGS